MGLFNLATARRATDAFGTPIPKAIRKIYPMGSVSSARTFGDRNLTQEIETEMVADEQGWFELCYVPDGLYRVEILDPKARFDSPLFSAENILVGPATDIDLWRSFRNQFVLEADQQLCYTNKVGGIQVQAGEIVYLFENDMQLCVMPPEETEFHVTSAGGVRFCETGMRYSNRARLVDAVARVEDFVPGSMVIAGSDVYVFHNDGRNTLPGLQGWSLALSPQTIEDVSTAKAKTDLISIEQPINLDMLPSMIAGSQTYTNVADLLASDVDFPTGTKIRTSSQGFSYEVAAPTATDHQLVTAGGAKLYVLPLAQGELPVAAFGPAMDGVTDDTDVVQAAFDAVEDGGTLLFPANCTLLIYGLQLRNKGAVIKLNGATLCKRPATSADNANMQEYTGDTGYWSNNGQYAPFIYCNGGEIHVQGPGVFDGQRDNETDALTQHGTGIWTAIDRAGIVAIDDGSDGSGCTRATVRDVEFKDMYGIPVEFLGVHDVTLERIKERNSSFLFTRSQGVKDPVTGEPPAGSRFIVRECDLHGTRENAGAPNNCFTISIFETVVFDRNILDGRDKLRRLFTEGSDGNYPDSPKFQNISELRVTNNTFYASGVKGGSGGGTVKPKLNYIVGNHFLTPLGFQGNSGIFSIESADTVKISDNVFENCNMRAIGAPIINGHIENNIFTAKERLYVWTDEAQTDTAYHALSITAAPAGSNGHLRVANNTIDGGGNAGHIGFFAGTPLGRLEIRQNIFRNLDNAITETGNNDQLHWEIIGNTFDNCRTVSELRFATCNILRIEGNFFGDLSADAPSDMAGWAGRGINLMTHGSPVWGEFIFANNIVKDTTQQWRLRCRDIGNGTTISRFEISNNNFVSNDATPVNDENASGGPSVANMVIEGNQFSGDVRLGQTWSVSDVFVDRNHFSNGQLFGVPIDRSVANLSANGAEGQRTYVTDAITPVLGAIATGGGTETVSVFYDGSDWRVG